MQPDIMDTAVCTLVGRSEVHEEGDLNLICKIMSLKSQQKELVNKFLDASDECQEVIDVLLSPTNTILDLVQKVIRANNQDLNLMRKITDHNSTEWDLFRRVIHLCDGKKYFMYKFMDWYLNDMSIGFSCSCSKTQGAEHGGKNGPCNAKKRDDTVVSGCTTRQGNSSEKCIPHQTNQDTSTEKLGKSCRENGVSPCHTDGVSLRETDAHTENRSVTKQVNHTEKDDSSAGYSSEAVAQQAQPTVKHSLSNERLCSGSSQCSEDVVERSVSHFECGDRDPKQKTAKLDCAGDNGNSTWTVTVVREASDTREDVTGAHGEMSLNTKSAISPYKSMEVQEEQTLAELGTNHNCHSRRVMESVQELPNIGIREAITPVLPKQDMDMEVHEQQIYNGSLQGNLSGINTSCSSDVESTETQSQSDTVNDCGVPGNGQTETQLDPSGKVNSKTYSSIHSFSIFSDDQSKASSKMVPPHSAI
jgi:hypothetical protein